MKSSLYTLDGKKKGEIELPSHFSEKPRGDLIRKVFKASQKAIPTGADPEAGKKYSAKLSRRRRDYKTAYGKGISRVPRKTIWRRGRQFGFVGAEAPGTVGGRKAHPPKAEKDPSQKINKKERQMAIRSAIACSAIPEIVKQRSHLFKDTPLIIEDALEDVSKTAEVTKILQAVGLSDELERIKEKKVRSGRGKGRGRPYRRKVGPLIVVSKKCPLQTAAKNIPGVSISTTNLLNIEKLAPGGVPGRLCIFPQASIKTLETLFGASKK